MRVVLIDQNQTDARYTMNRDGICQTVTARFGTGGGHVPMVILIDERRHNYEAVDVASTVTARYGTGGGNTPIVIITGETDEGLLRGKRSAASDEHGQRNEHA